MQAALSDACGQFEQVMIATLIPRSLLRPALDDDDGGASSPAHSFESDLFAQAFAAAIERAGGIGVRAELLQALEKRP
jgi:Rod binding domain-containing protein